MTILHRFIDCDVSEIVKWYEDFKAFKRNTLPSFTINHVEISPDGETITLVLRLTRT